MDYSLEHFKQEIESIFHLDFLTKERVPIDFGEYRFSLFPETRVNHYLIKLNNSMDYKFGDIKNEEMQSFVSLISKRCLENGIEIKDRYCYLTIDQGWVDPGKTLRTPGWYIDGLQGDEVPTKKLGDYQFIWTDCLPTIFSYQKFNVSNLNLSTHNVFKWLENQINPTALLEIKPFHIFAMNPYHVHTAVEAKEKIYRRFIRLSYTHTPVTSTKMTINSEMNYNYDYHITTGEIPSHLK